MKYFRYYPGWIQMILFLLICLTFLYTGVMMTQYLLPKFTGFEMSEIAGIKPSSSPALIHTSMVINGFLNMCMYMLSGLVFAYLSHPSMGEYLGLRKPGSYVQLVFVVLLIMGAQPLVEALTYGISLFKFSPETMAEQKASEDVTKAFLTMHSPLDFFRAFATIAITPALGEEFFFRGVLMRYATRIFRSPVRGIIFSAFIFAISHSNLFGLPAIFLAGCILGAIYYITGSLWASVLAHLFFNGSQVVLAYMATFNPALKNFLENDSNAAGFIYLGVGTALFTIGYLGLQKFKTPLPDNWTDDFRNEVNEDSFSDPTEDNK